MLIHVQVVELVHYEEGMQTDRQYFSFISGGSR